MRLKSQITLPAEIASRLGAKQGDHLLFSLLEGDALPRVEMRLLRRSYAGVAKGLYGESDEGTDRYLREERESWKKERP
ncbi:hypothetical protein EPN52_02470 [bacterium]|nr:MAG: hypothetical protein EPN52_02470 [bacterium]